MAYIMFSRHFPKAHPKAGHKTGFVEKIWMGLLKSGRYTREDMHTWLDKHDGELWDISYIDFGLANGLSPKVTTIRAGNSRRCGMSFEPRAWLDKPYASKQYQFAPALGIRSIQPFTRNEAGEFFVHGEIEGSLEGVAEQDGLALDDFRAWFSGPFTGQRIDFNNF